MQTIAYMYIILCQLLNHRVQICFLCHRLFRVTSTFMRKLRTAKSQRMSFSHSQTNMDIVWNEVVLFTGLLTRMVSDVYKVNFMIFIFKDLINFSLMWFQMYLNLLRVRPLK